MKIKKVLSLVADIGGEELSLIPITKRSITISSVTSTATSAMPTQTVVETLDVAKEKDKVIGYLLQPSQVEEEAK